MLIVSPLPEKTIFSGKNNSCRTLCSAIAETPESRAYGLKSVPTQFQQCTSRHIIGRGKRNCLTLYTKYNKPDSHHYAQ